MAVPTATICSDRGSAKQARPLIDRLVGVAVVGASAYLLFVSFVLGVQRGF
jgi:hypothetical protein